MKPDKFIKILLLLFIIWLFFNTYANSWKFYMGHGIYKFNTLTGKAYIWRSGGWCSIKNTHGLTGVTTFGDIPITNKLSPDVKKKLQDFRNELLEK